MLRTTYAIKLIAQNIKFDGVWEDKIKDKYDYVYSVICLQEVGKLFRKKDGTKNQYTIQELVDLGYHHYTGNTCLGDSDDYSYYLNMKRVLDAFAVDGV